VKFSLYILFCQAEFECEKGGDGCGALTPLVIARRYDEATSSLYITDVQFRSVSDEVATLRTNDKMDKSRLEVFLI